MNTKTIETPKQREKSIEWRNSELNKIMIELKERLELSFEELKVKHKFKSLVLTGDQHLRFYYDIEELENREYIFNNSLVLRME